MCIYSYSILQAIIPECGPFLYYNSAVRYLENIVKLFRKKLKQARFINKLLKLSKPLNCMHFLDRI